MNCKWFYFLRQLFVISFLTAMSLDGISCILCKCYVFFKTLMCLQFFSFCFSCLNNGLVFVHQMFRIISLFVAVCSVDRAQMSGMGMAFMKALSCLSLQRTGCRSSVNRVITALPPFFCIYRWMFVTVNLHLFKKRFFLHFQVLIPSFSQCHVCLFFLSSF